MSKVRRTSSATRSRNKAAEYDEYDEEEVSASSVIFGAVMLIAIIVAVAAWMGGSLNKVGSQFGNSMDSTARALGLSVHNVTVLGLEQDPALQAEIRAAAMIEPGENMFRANPELIRRRVEATRKVLNVRVHRLWPDQIVVIADAAEPVALYNDGKEWSVVDSLGRHVPGAQIEDHADLVKISGDGAPQAVPALIAAFGQSDELTSLLTEAKRVASRRWDVQLSNGVRISLPGDEHLGAAIARLSEINRRTSLVRRPVEQIDLRAPGKVFLKPAVTSPALSQSSGAA